MKTMNVSTVILAAGKGTRMGTDIPKVLVELNGKPMVHYVIETSKKLGAKKTVLVVGYKKEDVIDKTEKFDVFHVNQNEQLGTGHAVDQAREHFENDGGHVLVLYGDVPIITKETLQSLIDHHLNQDSDLTILTTEVENPTGYGRIITDNGLFKYIVEEKDASADEKAVHDINSGVMIAKSKELFDALKLVGNENSQNEYYLTDVPSILLEKNKKVMTYKTLNSKEVLGANTKEQLKNLEIHMLKND